MNDSHEWPNRLLQQAAWDFTNHGLFSSQSDFENAVAAYLKETAEDEPPDLTPEETWNAAAIAFAGTTIRLSYYSDPEDEDAGFHSVLLYADTAKGFTAGELLFKIHNATIERLSTSGHCWFEGLEFSRVSDDGVPEYILIPGS